MQTDPSQSLYYQIQGEGFPLLLLHGFTGSSHNWQHILPYLSRHHRVLAPDLIGHGRSPVPADYRRYSMEQAVDDLLALLDAQGIERFDLLGYSMGGRVALHLALAAPERVRLLVLESASPGIDDPAEREARRASDNALAERIEREGIEWFSDFWANQSLFASQRSLPAELQQQIRQQRLSQRPQGLANSLRGMGAGQQRSLWPELARLDMPVLLIAGMLDAKYVTISQRMASVLPHAKLRIVPGAGHTVHMEQAALYCQIVNAFFAAHERL